MLNNLSDRYNRLLNFTPLAVLLVAGGVFWVSYDSGSYGPTARGSIAVVLLWAAVLGISFSLWPNAALPTAAVVTGGLFAAFAAWTGLSGFWAASPENAFEEFNRAVVYLAAFALAVVVPARADIRRWLAGFAIGLTAVGLLALVSRLFPTSFAAPRELAQIFPSAERRLSYPVDYWNGLATLVAFALPLLLFFAVNARGLAVRALALSPIPALVATIYLTSSRGGSIAAALAVLVFLALTARRWTAVGATLVAGAASAAAVAVFVASSELVDHPHESATAVGQGHTAAVVVLVTCVLTGLAYAILLRLLPAPRPLGRVGAAVVGGIIVATVVVGLIAARPVHRFDEFKKTPPASFGSASVQQHLFAGSGNGRWQLWQSAVEEFKSRPVIGRGAGSYEAWWAQHGTLNYFVRDAHSLYVETLGELGIVGLAILFAFLVSVLVFGAMRLAGRAPDERSAVAALLGAFVAFLFEAAVDWIWELTAAGLVAALIAGLLTGPATETVVPNDAPPLVLHRHRSVRRFLRLGALTVLIALIVGESIPLLTTMKIRQSQHAVARGDLNEALDDAEGAESLQPWAASPYLQSALVYEQAGDVDAALRAIRSALSHDSSDWRLWVVATRLETKAGDIAAARESLARARELNPRSPLFRSG
jgi:hypothetical protein